MSDRMNDAVRELAKALGALSEFCRILASSLMDNGFTRAEAVDIAKSYLITMLTNNQNKQEEK